MCTRIVVQEYIEASYSYQLSTMSRILDLIVVVVKAVLKTVLVSSNVSQNSRVVGIIALSRDVYREGPTGRTAPRL